MSFLRNYFFSILTAFLAVSCYWLFALALSEGLTSKGIAKTAGNLTSSNVIGATVAYPSSVDLGDCWLWAQGYDFMYVGEFPWVYNFQTESWYFSAGTSNNLWLYADFNGFGSWAYTNENEFPWAWVEQQDTWSYWGYIPPPSDSGAIGSVEVGIVEEIIAPDEPAVLPAPSAPEPDEGETPSEEINETINEPISPTGGT